MEPNIPVMEETALTPKPDYAAEITRIVKSPASPNVMRERLEDYHEKDIAEVLPKLTSAERKSCTAFWMRIRSPTFWSVWKTQRPPDSFRRWTCARAPARSRAWKPTQRRRFFPRWTARKK